MQELEAGGVRRGSVMKRKFAVTGEEHRRACDGQQAVRLAYAAARFCFAVCLAFAGARFFFCPSLFFAALQKQQHNVN